MVDSFSFATKYISAVTDELRSVINLPDGVSWPLPPREFMNIVTYHMGWTDVSGNPVGGESGKRLRPLICLLSCEAAGGFRNDSAGEVWHAALPAAAAIELVHNFSLVHDDIEDNSSVRHGRETVWRIWGTAQGINAGDAIFVLARLALDRLGKSLPAPTYSDVHQVFDSATLALTQGQFLDLYFENLDDVTVSSYLEMVRCKTAALMAAAAQIGARIATDDERVLKAFASYGENFGIAFQISDDILGIWGDPKVTGKPAGDDIRARKKSLPIIAGTGLDPGSRLAGLLKNEVVSPEDVRNVLALLDRVNARHFSENLALKHAEAAIGALEATGISNEAVHHLVEIASRSVRRDR